MKFENQGYIQTFKPAYTLYQSHTICAETPGVQASFIPLRPSHVLRPFYTLVKLLGVDQVWYWERQVPGWEVEKLDWSGKISRGRWQRAKVEGRACQVRGEERIQGRADTSRGPEVGKWAERPVAWTPCCKKLTEGQLEGWLCG